MAESSFHGYRPLATFFHASDPRGRPTGDAAVNSFRLACPLDIRHRRPSGAQGSFDQFELFNNGGDCCKLNPTTSVKTSAHLGLECPPGFVRGAPAAAASAAAPERIAGSGAAGDKRPTGDSLVRQAAISKRANREETSHAKGKQNKTTPADLANSFPRSRVSHRLVVAQPQTFGHLHFELTHERAPVVRRRDLWAKH